MASTEIHLPIVWRREDCYTLTIVCHLIAHIFNLVTANDVIQIVKLTERLGDVGTKLYAYTALRWATAHPLLRVGP